jgi:hypothetical protein
VYTIYRNLKKIAGFLKNTEKNKIQVLMNFMSSCEKFHCLVLSSCQCRQGEYAGTRLCSPIKEKSWEILSPSRKWLLRVLKHGCQIGDGHTYDRLLQRRRSCDSCTPRSLVSSKTKTNESFFTLPPGRELQTGVGVE